LLSFKIKTSKHELHFKLNFKINFTKLSTFMMEDVFVKDMKISCYNSKLHLSNAHPIHTKNKDKNFNKNHQEYLPTAEKTFIRFWWQWSSGRFSAITMRDCQKNCMLERGREGRERERERESKQPGYILHRTFHKEHTTCKLSK
jgi:hypothetical protein